MRRSFLLFGSNDRPTEAFAAFLHDVGVPGEDLQSIDGALQKRFFQKSPDGQPLERWELKEVEVYCPIDRIKQHLASCGFLNATEPQGLVYTRAGWPGALLPRAAARLCDLIDAWQSGVRWTETIVFGGKRPLQTDKENMCAAFFVLGQDIPFPDYPDRPMDEWEYDMAGSDYRRSSPFPQQGIHTELDMMRWLWSEADIPLDLRLLPTIFVDAPMKPSLKEGGPPVRPTTEDTITEWLKSNPIKGCLLLSSGDPYGMAQDEAFWMLLECHGHTVETFGHAAPDLPIENLMREVAGTVNRIRKARKA